MKLIKAITIFCILVSCTACGKGADQQGIPKAHSLDMAFISEPVDQLADAAEAVDLSVPSETTQESIGTPFTDSIDPIRPLDESTVWIENDQDFTVVFDGDLHRRPSSVSLQAPRTNPADHMDMLLTTQERYSTWQEAYAVLLREYAEWSEYLYFLLHDFDNDGIPELIVMGHEYYDGGELVDAVFTFKNGEVLSLEYDGDVAIAGFALGARTRMLAAPGDAPGLIVYRIGPSAGVFGTSVNYYRIVIDGQRLVIDAHGERYIDISTLSELYNDFGYGSDIDQAALINDINQHTHYYINDSAVPEKELCRTFELGNQISFSSITEANIQQVIFALPEPPNNVIEITAYLLGNLGNPVLVEESKYHRIFRSDYYYLAMVFDKNENLVAFDHFISCPQIFLTDDRIVSISSQAGAGIETRWTYYYSIEQDVFSDVFYAVFQQKDNMIILRGENGSIIVRDIFDENGFFQVLSGFDGISADTVSPFIGAEFIDDGQRISVTYLDEQFEELIAVLDLTGIAY